MPDPKVVILGEDGTRHVFPAGFDPARAAAIVRGQPTQEAVSQTEPTVPPSTNTALEMQAARRVLPIATDAIQGFATSPTVARTGATIGRIAGSVAPPVVGALKYGPVGGLLGLREMAAGGWAGGKTGWFTGKLLQRAAMPIANTLEKAAPYAQTLGTLSGAQGVLDLAQMAEPNRTDVGFLGASTSDQKPAAWTTAQWEQYRKEHPPVLNRIWSALSR